MYGPSGFGISNAVRSSVLLPYRIEYENYGPGSVDHSGQPVSADRWATAPAQRVEITNRLSGDFDLDTFQLTGFGWADFNFSIGPGNQSHQQIVPMNYNNQTFDVWFEASLDRETRLLRIVFQSINPFTQLPPDVLTGFLPPEPADQNGSGRGFVTYTIKALPDTSDGTEIRNIALISFDHQPAIATNQIDPLDPAQGTDPNREALVTIDALPPSVVVPPQFNSMQKPHGIQIKFNEDVSSGLSVEDFVVIDRATGERVPSVQLALTFDAVTNIALLTFPGATNNGIAGVLPDGRYRVTLRGADVTDGVGYEMTTDILYDFKFKLADFDNSGTVEFNDLLTLAQHYGQTVASYADGDANYDGKVDFSDLLIFAQRYGQQLPQFGAIVTSARFAAANAPNEVRFVFNDSVANSLQAADLQLTNLTTGASVPSTQWSVAWESVSRTAVFRTGAAIGGIAPGVLPEGRYRAALPLGSVALDTGEPLLNSYSFDFSILYGDSNSDGRVDFTDLLALAQNYGQSGKTLTQGDFNYDGSVNFTNLLVLAQRYGSTMLSDGSVTPATGLPPGLFEKLLSDKPTQPSTKRTGTRPADAVLQ